MCGVFPGLTLGIPGGEKPTRRNTPTHIFLERNRRSSGVIGFQLTAGPLLEWALKPSKRTARGRSRKIYKEAPVSAIVSLRGVSKQFPVQGSKRGRGNKRAESVRAVDRVTLDIEEGTVVGIVGYSGAG
jgi:D-methionine transport system ATP-binding protein